MEEFIVAIELGSTKIVGVAGRKELDGSFSIIAVAKEDASACIRKGVVYNIDKTVTCIKNIVGKLENTLKHKIARVYVGVGGQSLRSIKNVVGKDLPTNTIVSVDMIDELRDTNRNMPYPDMEILNAAIQEYKVDNQLQIDPVGIPCQHLDGNFLNIVWRKSFYSNLNKCFELANLKIAELRISLLTLANNVLTEAEKRAGCVLVDLGADTTSVAVYHKNILRHLAVIPLGGNNITKDIASEQIDEEVAERMKLKYGNAWSTENTNGTSESISIDNDRSIDKLRFNQIVEARTEEIVLNVMHQIPYENSNNLLGGIILTGGGANLKNIEAVFRNQPGISKVRTVRFINQEIHTLDENIKSQNGMYNTVLSLMVSGDMNCAGEKITGDLFTMPVEEDPEPKTATERDPIRVPTKEVMEQEASDRKKRLEELGVDVNVGKEEEEPQPKKPGNPWWKQMGHKISSMLGSLIDEDD